jgi:transcriptional regulator with XRE-family HTH domain
MEEETFPDTLGRRIRAARMRRGVGQAELARAIGVSKNGMNAMEKDRSNPRADHLRAMARVLRVSADYLLGFTEEMTPKST